MGGFEPGLLGSGEPTVRYHPGCAVILTYRPDRAEGHWLVGSLTGAVASQNVTEAREARLRLFGNQPQSAIV